MVWSLETAKRLTWHKKKNGGKVKHCVHEALKLDKGIRELEGKNLLLDPWYVLVHGMGPYKVGQPYRGRG